MLQQQQQRVIYQQPPLYLDRPTTHDKVYDHTGWPSVLTQYAKVKLSISPSKLAKMAELLQAVIDQHRYLATETRAKRLPHHALLHATSQLAYD